MKSKSSGGSIDSTSLSSAKGHASQHHHQQQHRHTGGEKGGDMISASPTTGDIINRFGEGKGEVDAFGDTNNKINGNDASGGDSCLLEAKLCFLGNSKSGKSTVLEMLCSRFRSSLPFSNIHRPTNNNNNISNNNIKFPLVSSSINQKASSNHYTHTNSASLLNDKDNTSYANISTTAANIFSEEKLSSRQEFELDDDDDDVTFRLDSAKSDIRLNPWEYDCDAKYGEQDEDMALRCSLLCIITVDVRTSVADFASTLDRWTSLRQKYAKESACFVVGTFGDLISQRRMNIADASAVCRSRQAVYIEVSSRIESDMALLEALLLRSMKEAIDMRASLLTLDWEQLLTDDDDYSNPNRSTVDEDVALPEGSNSTLTSSSNYVPLLSPIVLSSATSSFLSSFIGCSSWEGTDASAVADPVTNHFIDREVVVLATTAAAERLNTVVDLVTTTSSTSSDSSTSSNLYQTATNVTATTASASVASAVEALKGDADANMRVGSLYYIDETEAYMKDIDRFESDKMDHRLGLVLIPEGDESDLIAAFGSLDLNYSDLSSDSVTSLDSIVSQRLPLDVIGGDYYLHTSPSLSSTSPARPGVSSYSSSYSSSLSSQSDLLRNSSSSSYNSNSNNNSSSSFNGGGAVSVRPFQNIFNGVKEEKSISSDSIINNGSSGGVGGERGLNYPNNNTSNSLVMGESIPLKPVTTLNPNPNLNPSGHSNPPTPPKAGNSIIDGNSNSDAHSAAYSSLQNAKIKSSSISSSTSNGASINNNINNNNSGNGSGSSNISNKGQPSAIPQLPKASLTSSSSTSAPPLPKPYSNPSSGPNPNLSALSSRIKVRVKVAGQVADMIVDRSMAESKIEAFVDGFISRNILTSVDDIARRKLQQTVRSLTTLSSMATSNSSGGGDINSSSSSSSSNINNLSSALVATTPANNSNDLTNNNDNSGDSSPGYASALEFLGVTSNPNPTSSSSSSSMPLNYDNTNLMNNNNNSNNSGINSNNSTPPSKSAVSKAPLTPTPAAVSNPDQLKATKPCILKFQIPPIPGKESSSGEDDTVSVRIRVGDLVKTVVDDLCATHHILYLKDALFDKIKALCT